MAADYSLLCSIELKIRTKWVTVFVAILNIFIVSLQFLGKRSFHTHFEGLLYVLSVLATILMIVGLFSKKAWMLIPSLLGCSFQTLHFMINSLGSAVMANYPEQTGGGFIIYPSDRNDKGYLMKLFVRMHVRLGAIYLAASLLSAVLLALVCRCYHHIRKLEMKPALPTRNEESPIQESAPLVVY